MQGWYEASLNNGHEIRRHKKTFKNTVKDNFNSAVGPKLSKNKRASRILTLTIT